MILVAQRLRRARRSHRAPHASRRARSASQYDSLADLIAFGVAPGILVYKWALEPWGRWGWLAASLYVTCGALRLARFNVQVDTVEKRHFLGLADPGWRPTSIASTVLLYYYLGGEGATNKHVLMLLADLRGRGADGERVPLHVASRS